VRSSGYCPFCFEHGARRGAAVLIDELDLKLWLTRGATGSRAHNAGCHDLGFYRRRLARYDRRGSPTLHPGTGPKTTGNGG
jgi:hypothetical protein